MLSRLIESLLLHMLEIVIKKLTFYFEYRGIEYQLEAHPIESNEQLISFNIRSRGISWKNLITPLQSRGPVRYLNEPYDDLENYGILVEENIRRKVLVCHDMMGNYLEDRYYSISKKWDDYRFYHWAGIDYFCYFSHKYITIPPSNWINAAHSHGVPVLGTFITEGQNGDILLKEVLQSKETIDTVVESMVKLCEHFCFEGWLINVECSLPETKINDLVYFLDVLRLKVNNRILNGVVFWYDSVIKSGSLAWQNEINDNNKQFFNICNGTLVNYSWSDESLKRTENTIVQESRKREDVFFGIDVFARGQIAKFHSHQTLARIVKHNFSVGIFAPGWTFEGLAERGYNIRTRDGNEDVNESFLLRNDKFWGLLWKYLATHSYHELPFYTDFCLGSGKFTFTFGKKTDRKFFSLSRQSLQPSVPLKDNAERSFDYGVNGGSCLKIITFNRAFRLFLTEFLINKTLIFAYVSHVEDPDSDLECILIFNDQYKMKTCELVCGNYETSYQGRVFAKSVTHDTFRIINQILSARDLPLKLPFKMDYGWNVRYYLIHFDEPVILRDIGVNLRTPALGQGTEGYLGAIYCHSIDEYVFSSLNVYTHLNFVTK